MHRHVWALLHLAAAVFALSKPRDVGDVLTLLETEDAGHVLGWAAKPHDMVVLLFTDEERIEELRKPNYGAVLQVCAKGFMDAAANNERMLQQQQQLYFAHGIERHTAEDTPCGQPDALWQDACVVFAHTDADAKHQHMTRMLDGNIPLSQN
eukprot:TRINITY_DN36063_c0_g1_i2.p1 TRINITY_DN36063_c0_g1~~TRINITY_DN36063_c0_g1_i2.p1  ORF type:complete len:152 (+),score=40.69 TRINITY_DN36063_c0_g1_i2:46-501(+)